MYLKKYGPIKDSKPERQNTSILAIKEIDLFSKKFITSDLDSLAYILIKIDGIVSYSLSERDKETITNLMKLVEHVLESIQTILRDYFKLWNNQEPLLFSMKNSIFIRELITNSDKSRLKDFMMVEINEMLDSSEINKFNMQSQKENTNSHQKNIPKIDKNNINCNKENSEIMQTKKSQEIPCDFDTRKRRFAIHVIGEARKKQQHDYMTNQTYDEIQNLDDLKIVHDLELILINTLKSEVKEANLMIESVQLKFDVTNRNSEDTLGIINEEKEPILFFNKKISEEMELDLLDTLKSEFSKIYSFKDDEKNQSSDMVNRNFFYYSEKQDENISEKFDRKNLREFVQDNLEKTNQNLHKIQQKNHNNNFISRISKENQIFPIMVEVSGKNSKADSKKSGNPVNKSLSQDKNNIDESFKIASPKSNSLSPLKRDSFNKSEINLSFQNHSVSIVKSIPSSKSSTKSNFKKSKICSKRKILLDSLKNSNSKSFEEYKRSNNDKAKSSNILLKENKTQQDEGSNSYEQYDNNSKNNKSSKSERSSKDILSDDENPNQNSKSDTSKNSHEMIVKKSKSDIKAMKDGLLIFENSNIKNVYNKIDEDLQTELEYNYDQSYHIKVQEFVDEFRNKTINSVPQKFEKKVSQKDSKKDRYEENSKDIKNYSQEKSSNQKEPLVKLKLLSKKVDQNDSSWFTFTNRPSQNNSSQKYESPKACRSPLKTQRSDSKDNNSKKDFDQEANEDFFNDFSREVSMIDQKADWDEDQTKIYREKLMMNRELEKELVQNCESSQSDNYGEENSSRYRSSEVEETSNSKNNGCKSEQGPPGDKINFFNQKIVSTLKEYMQSQDDSEKLVTIIKYMPLTDLVEIEKMLIRETLRLRDFIKQKFLEKFKSQFKDGDITNLNDEKFPNRDQVQQEKERQEKIAESYLTKRTVDLQKIKLLLGFRKQAIRKLILSMKLISNQGKVMKNIKKKIVHNKKYSRDSFIKNFDNASNDYQKFLVESKLLLGIVANISLTSLLFWNSQYDVRKNFYLKFSD